MWHVFTSQIEIDRGECDVKVTAIINPPEPDVGLLETTATIEAVRVDDEYDLLDYLSDSTLEALAKEAIETFKDKNN